MTVITITGSRSIEDYEWIKSCIAKALVDENIFDPIFLIGDAKGVDEIACGYLNYKRYVCIVFKPAHHIYSEITYQRELFLARNYQMVENSQLVIALWDGHSAGTKNTMDIAKQLGVKVVKFIY